MAAPSQPTEWQQRLSQYKPDKLAEIIDKLAGEKCNLKISIQELKFNYRKTKYAVSGEINFNVVHAKEPSSNQVR